MGRTTKSNTTDTRKKKGIITKAANVIGVANDADAILRATGLYKTTTVKNLKVKLKDAGIDFSSNENDKLTLFKLADGQSLLGKDDEDKENTTRVVNTVAVAAPTHTTEGDNHSNISADSHQYPIEALLEETALELNYTRRQLATTKRQI